MKRPTHNGEDHGQFVTTPSAAMMFQLLGDGYTRGSIALTRDQITRIHKIYGFTPEAPNEKPAAPPTPQEADFPSRYDFEKAVQKWKADVKALDAWVDPRAMLQAGADRNAMRYAEIDGLRLIAWISRFIAPGEDPLKLIVALACEAGYDVDPADREWALADEDTEQEQP